MSVSEYGTLKTALSLSKMIEGHSAREPAHDLCIVSLKMENSMIWEEMITNCRKRVVLTSRNQLFKYYNYEIQGSGRDLLYYVTGTSTEEMFNDSEFFALLSSDP